MLTSRIYAHARHRPEKTAIVLNNLEIPYRVFAALIEISRRHLAARGLAGDGIAVLPTGSMMDTWVLSLALRSLGLTTLIVRSQDQIVALGLPEIRCVVAIADEPIGLDRLCADFGLQFVGVPGNIYADVGQAGSPDLPEWTGPFGGHIQLTSGTTGAYKKVMADATHQGRRSAFLRTLFEITENSVVNVLNFGCWTAIGHNYPACTWDIGGTVVIYQGLDLHESFRYRGISHTYTIPQTLMKILSAPAPALRRDDEMRLFVAAGPLTQAVADATQARLTRRVYTNYASTEASSATVTQIVSPEDLRWHRVVPSRKVQVVDEEDRVRPTGQLGMVRVDVVDGITGYLNDEAATRAFFRSGYFYPGDIGVLRSDGRLALYGRMTDVVNILGSKIATGPIEEALQHELGVSGVCVLSLQNKLAEEEIHVVVETARPIEQARLAVALGRELPGASSAHVHFVETLPRNDMGKIQRDVLRSAAALSALKGSSDDLFKIVP